MSQPRHERTVRLLLALLAAMTLLVLSVGDPDAPSARPGDPTPDFSHEPRRALDAPPERVRPDGP